MALLYQAQLTPSKIELLSSWVPLQPWAATADTATLDVRGAFRFDDPDGEVGVETHLLGTADGQVLHVPVTYRGAPLAGAESALIGTLHHSVLGRRWVYDGCGDPVYVATLVATVLTGGTQAELEVATDAGPTTRREPTTRVAGSGSAQTRPPVITTFSYDNDATATVVRTGDLELTVLRVVAEDGPQHPAEGGFTLTGTWPGHDRPALLATVRTG